MRVKEKLFKLNILQQGLILGFFSLMIVLIMQFIGIGVETKVLLDEGYSIYDLYIRQCLEMFIFTSMSWIVGNKLSSTLGIDISLRKLKEIGQPKVKKIIITGFVLALLIKLMDIIIFGLQLVPSFDLVMGFLEALSYIIYDGIIMAIIYNIGLITFFSWLISRLIYKSNEEKLFHSKLFGVLLTGLFLVIIQLPMVQHLYGLNIYTLIYELVSVGLPVIVIGLLFIKEGFTSSLVCSMTMNLILVIISKII